MVRGWEFRWQSYHYYVGAPDPATARDRLRKRHRDFANQAPAPTEMPQRLVRDLKLVDGSVRSAAGKSSMPKARGEKRPGDVIGAAIKGAWQQQG